MSQPEFPTVVDDNPELQPASPKALAVVPSPPSMAVGPPISAPLTPEQAKVNAIADLTHAAYAKASTLALTAEEQAALQKDFPDEAFKPGAAGKESLIYIEHAFLRDRFNQVFGPGQWALIPRSRWAEDFTTSQGKQASRIYVEAMLLVRGCFVAEAVGDMVYWKNNESQNYGDACEGAKTAALRRCCKELGVGLQAWKKDFCDGWWARRREMDKRALSCPIIALLSGDDYNNLNSLRKTVASPPNSKESQILLNRLQQATRPQVVSLNESPTGSVYFHVHDGSDLRITGEYRLVGQGVLGFQGTIAVMFVRLVDSQGGKASTGGSHQGLSEQQQKANVLPPRSEELRPSGRSGDGAHSLHPRTAVAQATPETRQKLIEKLMALQNIGEEQILEYFRKLDNPTVLLPTEGLLDLPLEFVPVTQKQFEALKLAIVAFTEGGPLKHAFPPNPVAPPVPATKPVEVPRDKETATPEAVEAWRAFPMPWGKQAGVPLGELEKPYLFGLWANFKVELEYNGKPKKPETIAKDKTFRKMLDSCGEHYGFKKD